MSRLTAPHPTTGAPVPPGAVGEWQMQAMCETSAKGKTRRPRPSEEEGIDLERVVWDPEYRTMVRDRLNRERPRRRVPRKPAGA